MKKLALVTLLAVAASWLLTEPETPSPVKTPRISLLRDFDGPPSPPKPPEPVRPASGRKSKDEAARSRRVSKTSQAVASTPAPTMPEWFPKTEVEEEAKANPDAAGLRVLVGRVSVSEDRARQDLRKTLEREVSEWIAADVPPTWKPPASLVDRMVRGTYVQKVARSLRPSTPEPASDPTVGPPTPDPDLEGLDSLYTLYRAGQQVDFSDARKSKIVQAYRKDLATQRIKRLGGGLALTLGLLAVMTGYIRADEATRGYYTNRLRLAAVAGLGAAGVAAYRFLG